MTVAAPAGETTAPPRLREEREIQLYSTAGRVVPARSFAAARLDLLDTAEADLVRQGLAELPDRPPALGGPWVRTPRLADGRRQLAARRAGARSAYLPAAGLKLKACRPEAAGFPEWGLGEDFELEVREIPFGVLTTAGAMRELLAYCFLCLHRLPAAGRPLAVFEYAGNGSDTAGHALLTATPVDERLEARLDCRGLTLHDVVRRARAGDTRPREVRLAGMSRRRYVEDKVELLLGLHLHGGFRGLLNSNIGNDVVHRDRLLALCDFDTFRLRPLPAAGDASELRRFTCHCVIEVVKSSLPLIDFIDLQPTDGEAELGPLLVARYRAGSRLFRRYRARFLAAAAARGWPLPALRRHFEEALALPVVRTVLQEIVPNAYTARRLDPESHYVPHD